MKNIFYTFILFLVSVASAYSQDYTKVDAVVRAYPNSFASVDKFAERINKDFTSNEEKARALFTWMAINIKYDVVAYREGVKPKPYTYRTQEEKEAIQKRLKEELAEKTLKTKKGVCQGYATLYSEVGAKTGLEVVLIPGTTKAYPTDIGKEQGSDKHLWNAVKINGKWKLVDVTWGAGTVSGNPIKFEFNFNDKYFFSDPEMFFLNRFPEDKQWLLTDKTEKDFADLPLYYGNCFMEGYEFVSPTLGIFTNKKSDVITFAVKNLKPGDRIVYAFSKTKAFKEVQPVTEGDVSKFEVELGDNSSGYLTIFINQKSIVAYKINRA